MYKHFKKSFVIHCFQYYKLFQWCPGDTAIAHQPDLLLPIPVTPQRSCPFLKGFFFVSDAQSDQIAIGVFEGRRNPVAFADDNFNGLELLTFFTVIAITNTDQCIALYHQLSIVADQRCIGAASLCYAQRSSSTVSSPCVAAANALSSSALQVPARLSRS